MSSSDHIDGQDRQTESALPPEKWIVLNWSFRLYFHGWEKN